MRSRILGIASIDNLSWRMLCSVTLRRTDWTHGVSPQNWRNLGVWMSSPGWNLFWAYKLAYARVLGLMHALTVWETASLVWLELSKWKRKERCRDLTERWSREKMTVSAFVRSWVFVKRMCRHWPILNEKRMQSGPGFAGVFLPFWESILPGFWEPFICLPHKL